MSEEPVDILSAVPLEDTRDSQTADGDGDMDRRLRGRQDPRDLPELSNSLDKEAFRGEKEESRRDDLQVPSLLPGEVEREGLPACISPVIRSTQLEMSSTADATSSTASPSGEQATRSTAAAAQGEHATHPACSVTGMHASNAATVNEQQVESDEAQPFYLDQNFDYDHVVLTHKYPTLQQNPTAS